MHIPGTGGAAETAFTPTAHAGRGREPSSRRTRGPARGPETGAKPDIESDISP
jgi:hypothetical protein